MLTLSSPLTNIQLSLGVTSTYANYKRIFSGEGVSGAFGDSHKMCYNYVNKICIHAHGKHNSTHVLITAIAITFRLVLCLNLALLMSMLQF